MIETLEQILIRHTPRPIMVADGARMETTTLMPDGGLVTLYITPEGQTFRVSDDHQGAMTLFGLGLGEVTRGDKTRGGKIAEEFGLDFDGEGFALSGVDPEVIPSAIVYVANAVRAWTHEVLEARRQRTERDLADRVEARLREVLRGLSIDRERPLQGASSKRHRFDLVVSRGGEPLAAFEALSPFAGSVAAAHLKFFDLQQASPLILREAVVDDPDRWEAVDLALMQQVTSHIRPIGGPWADLEALAA